jgi:hypothetical protein
MAKKTYFTKADLIDFGKYIESDYRRGLKQKEARKSFEAGVINSLPWTTSIRFVCENDFLEWKEYKEKINL